MTDEQERVICCGSCGAQAKYGHAAQQCGPMWCSNWKCGKSVSPPYFTRLRSSIEEDGDE